MTLHHMTTHYGPTYEGILSGVCNAVRRGPEGVAPVRKCPFVMAPSPDEAAKLKKGLASKCAVAVTSLTVTKRTYPTMQDVFGCPGWPAQREHRWKELGDHFRTAMTETVGLRGERSGAAIPLSWWFERAIAMPHLWKGFSILKGKGRPPPTKVFQLVKTWRPNDIYMVLPESLDYIFRQPDAKRSILALLQFEVLGDDQGILKADYEPRFGWVRDGDASKEGRSRATPVRGEGSDAPPLRTVIITINDNDLRTKLLATLEDQRTCLPSYRTCALKGVEVEVGVWNIELLKNCDAFVFWSGGSSGVGTRTLAGAGAATQCQARFPFTSM